MKPEQFAKELLATLKGYIKEALDASAGVFSKRLDVVEQKLSSGELVGPAGAPGEKGEPGQDAPAPTPEEMEKAVKAFMASTECGNFMVPIIQEAVKAHMPPAPKDGENGRDALQLEILPELPVNKSVSRGTYAIHKGGLWRSFEATAGMRGWECLVDGIAGITLQPEGERGLKICIERSSGQTTEQELNLPVMIYRGVFEAGTTYEKGDVVTWGGSSWHCNQLTAAEPGTGEGAEAWTLAVKRGRDGKTGAPGPQGKPGEAGKDFTPDDGKMKMVS